MEDLKNVAPLQEFDWDAFENGSAAAGMSKEQLEQAYDTTLNKVADNEVVNGTVTAINKREVIVNIGYKSDGIIPISEFRYNPDLKVGDEVEVYIENTEDRKGQLLLSHKKARESRSWDRVNEALDSQEIVKGYIKCRTKGGMIVDVFVGKTMEFKVIKINQEYRNVVVSHKALIEGHSRFHFRV